MRSGFIAGLTLFALVAPASANGPQLKPGFYVPQQIACTKALLGDVTTFFPNLAKGPSLGFGAFAPSVCEARRLSSRRYRVGCGRLRDTSEAQPSPPLLWTTVEIVSPTRYREIVGRRRVIFRWCGARDSDIGSP